MTATDPADLALRAADEDFWLAAQFAPAALRPKLTALFLLRAEIVRIPEAVTEPAIGEMRLQWWREAIAALPRGEAPKGQPALAAAEGANLLAAVAPEIFDRAIDAQARILYEPYFASPADLGAWLRGAEGSFAAAAMRIAHPDARSQDLAAAEAAGAAFALARDGRDRLAHPDAPTDAAYDALVAEAAPSLTRLPDAARGAILYAALAPLYRRASSPTGLAKRWRLFRAALAGALLR